MHPESVLIDLGTQLGCFQGARDVFEPIRGAWNILMPLSMLIDAFLIAEVVKSQYPCCTAYTLFALYVRSVTSEK